MATMQLEREGLIREWDIGDRYRIEFHRWLPNSDYYDLLRPLRIRAAWVNSRVFPMNPIQTAEEILAHIRGGVSGSIMFATLDDQDIGICIQSVKEVRLSDGRSKNVVWNALRAIEPGHQRKGIGTTFLERSFEVYSELYHPRRLWPHYYGGRTQNEPVLMSYERAKIQKNEAERIRLFDGILPIDESYQDGSDEQQILWYLASRAMRPTIVDKNTGVAQRVYPEGRTGGFVPDLRNRRYRRIRRRFEELGLNKDRGDAIYYVARLNPILLET